ncbi:MAG: TrmH family RNA methyltransferase [Actinomycetota bacterium]
MRNPRVLAARKLLRRAERERAGAFLVEGPLGVRDALRAGLATELFVAEEGHGFGELIDLAERSGVDAFLAGPGVIEALSDTTTPQGVVAVARANSCGTDELEGSTLVTVLAGVRDPGNAGTLIRSSLAAGADGVVMPRGAVDPFNPKTVRAAAGALFAIRVAVPDGIEGALQELKGLGLRLIGADARSAAPPEEVDLTEPVALVLGNEAWGIPGGQAALLDAIVGIPMPGPAESLNVGIAGSILLFEAVRQRRLSSRFQ